MSSRDILIEQLGNENSYRVLVTKYCNHIRDNDDLTPFFGDIDTESLVKLEEEFLKAAFTTADGGSGRMHRRVSRLHRKLFDLGLDETHFDVLKEHFLDALNDFCLEDDAYEACSKDLDSMRYIFEENARKNAKRRGRRSSLGHRVEPSSAPVDETTIAGIIPPRSNSLPPKRNSEDNNSTRGVKRGMLAVTKSGDKLKAMFQAGIKQKLNQ
ncbi:unnamed protein product [Cylindrotheca closterium]|uniref:Uncharacterized protein n=1 Tax=Cylindrotheca closterium TaxID=2856 RepID=A0AAD2FH46_9STRA|nr:unnamed protein product [Cylindrotheca closterium]